MAAEWRQKAERGDPEAMAQLGLCYYYGSDGVATDYAQAVVWFRKAIDHGHAEAMYWLGACYYWGHGVPQDYAQAATWYRKAIAAGSTTGGPEYWLGNQYEDGHGVRESLPEAFKWYRAGAAKGSQNAKNDLDRLKKAHPNEWPGWERECVAAEQREKDRLAAEKAEQKERERREAEQCERVAAQQREAAERERVAAQQRERDRLAAEQREQERRAAEQKERDRQAAELRAQRLKIVKPADWDVDDLAVWLDQLALSDLVATFKREKINGAAFVDLTNDDLKDIGVSELGLRKNVLKQRDQLLATTVPAAPTPTPAAAPSPKPSTSPLAQPPSLPATTPPALEGQVAAGPADQTAFNLPASQALQVVLDRIEARHPPTPSPASVSVTAEIQTEIQKVQVALQRQLELAASRQSRELLVANQQLAGAQAGFVAQLDRLQSEAERANQTASLVKIQFATYLPLLQQIEQKEKSRTNIIGSLSHQQYYRAYMEVLNATYQAAMVIYSGFVDVNANNTASKLGAALTGVGKVARIVPVAGQAVSIGMIATGFLFRKVGERDRRAELGRITSRFPNPAAWFDKVENAAAGITVDVRWSAIAALKPAAAQSSSWFSGVTGFFKEAAALFRGSSASSLSVWQMAAVSDATASLEFLMRESCDATEYTLVERLKAEAASHVWPVSIAPAKPASNYLRVRVKLEGRSDDGAVLVPVSSDLHGLLANASVCLEHSIVTVRDGKTNALVLNVSVLRDMELLVASTAKQEEDRQRRNKLASK